MTIYADDLPYWRTSQKSPEAWIALAGTEIERADGEVLFHGFARHPDSGAWYWLLRFTMGDDTFKIEWPVLAVWRETKSSAQDAKRQAATMLYRDVKAMCVKARALGARTAFFAHVEVDGGRTASQLGSRELVSAFPLALPAAPDDVIEGEVEEA